MNRNIPFTWRLASLVFGILILLGALMGLLYGLVLCPLSWFFWIRRDRNVLLVHNGTSTQADFLLQIRPFVDGRAIELDYSQRKLGPYGPSRLSFLPVLGPILFQSVSCPIRFPPLLSSENSGGLEA
jgi:hypothetical protein